MTAVSLPDVRTESGVVPSSSPIPPARRVAGALCLPAFFLALLATGPLDPLDDGGPNAAQLQQAAGHLGELQLLALVELVAAVLLVGVVLAFAGRTRGRGQTLGNLGVVLGVPGGMAMALIGIHHALLAVLAAQPVASATQILDGLDSAVMPLLLPLMLCGPIALVLLAGSGLRAGFVPRPAFALVAVFGVSDWIPALPMGELVPLLFGLAGFGWIAVDLLRKRS